MRLSFLWCVATVASGFVGPACPRRPVQASLRAEAEGEASSSGKDAAEAEVAPPPTTPPPPPPKQQYYDVSKLVKSDEGAGFNQFDPVLTASSFLSRRFGIVGGLAIFGGLLAIEGKEIVGSLFESGPETASSGDVVTTASGLKYVDVLVGKGGSSPLPGYVIGLQAKVSIGDKVIYDTKDDKPIAWKYGTRPFQNVLCDGVEEGIRGMKVGGQRKLLVPKALAPPGVDLPADVPLVYDVTLTEVLSGYF
mmetsp:Transcript_16234/g.52844  ORF Transcript_16234/g.52844 Transcript_16234/m.52844 type:complete len:250 (+) Transcript_16234:86-835(+)|eukprot:CAMPEP_0118915628 /NCGR_PEP_ID=MMETSP1166-20130328/15752_1 /TAXON_ID=1104430 /ORGANISM="Chrysoreinhardia sp, Strain CCMP3193" /LENGTH=249 /DNA_ID=CAMNT_0006855347 /DNA_START=64 /DNA_END=813 /DNA_ORIENTATION=+